MTARTKEESVTLTDMQKHFIKHDGVDSGISKQMYKNICHTFFKLLSKKILSGTMVSTPFELGIMYIKGIKTDLDRLRVNMNETRKLGYKVYHLNEHSDGYYGRWTWSRISKALVETCCFSFTATRANKRAIAAIFKTPGEYKRFSR